MQAGKRHTEESKVLIRAVRAKQPSAIIGRYGITAEIFDCEIAAGNLWCKSCKKFLDPELFGARIGVCSACNRAQAAKYRVNRTEATKRRQNEDTRAWRISRPLHIRKQELAKKYDVTVEWYESTLASQGGHCALCPAEFAHPGSKKVLFVDHDHRTGAVRGILCAKCNTHLGIIEADPEWHDKALEYLTKSRKVVE
jgi:hypothetical protein